MPLTDHETSKSHLDLSNFEVTHSADGIHDVVLKRYEDFAELLSEKYFRDRPEYVFRGHRDPSWNLAPLLYRHFDSAISLPSSSDATIFAREDAGLKTAAILRDFTFALRGTEYLHKGHEKLISTFDNNPSLDIKRLFLLTHSDMELRSTIYETWALGQHHGLMTPLLDWTESPLVGLYFAFEKEDDRGLTQEHRVVYALNRKLISQKCSSDYLGEAKIDFLSPMTRFNFRLLSQRGLFTYCFDYRPIEEWISDVYRGSDLPILVRIRIPNVNQKECLRWLNKMGFNAQTLFPDLIGICNFCNQLFLDPKLGWKAP